MKVEDPFYDAADELQETLNKGNMLINNINNLEFTNSNNEIEFDTLSIDITEQLNLLRKMLEVFIMRSNSKEIFDISRIEVEKRTNILRNLEMKVDAFLHDKSKIKIEASAEINAHSNFTKQKECEQQQHNNTTSIAHPDDFILSQEQTQREEVQNQDEVLDRLTYGLSELRETGTNINEELLSQHIVLTEVDRDVSRLQLRLRAANAKVDKLLASMSNKGKICCIILLIFVIIILALFVFH